MWLSWRFLCRCALRRTKDQCRKTSSAVLFDLNKNYPTVIFITVKIEYILSRWRDTLERTVSSKKEFHNFTFIGDRNVALDS